MRRTLGIAVLVGSIVAASPLIARVEAAGEPMELTVRVTTEGAAAPDDARYEVTVRCSPEGGATLRFTGPGQRTLETSAESCVVETAFPANSTGITYRCRAASPASCTEAVNVVERDADASGGVATVTIVFEYPDTTTTTASGAPATTSSTSTASTTIENPSTTSTTETSASSSSTTSTTEEPSTTLELALRDQDDEDSDTGLIAVGLIALAAVLAAIGMFIARRRRRAVVVDEPGPSDVPPAP